MIAPVREPPARATGSPNRLITARRAVADALLKQTVEHPVRSPRVSNLWAWAFVAWAAAVAISYLAMGGWWTIARY
jgi:hypothetical protein